MNTNYSMKNWLIHPAQHINKTHQSQPKQRFYIALWKHNLLSYSFKDINYNFKTQAYNQCRTHKIQNKKNYFNSIIF